MLLYTNGSGCYSMRVLVIGASGFIGSILFRDFAESHEVFGTYCHTPQSSLQFLNITNKASVEHLLSTLNPEVVVQPAAQPWVDFCEQQPEESYKINVQGAMNIIDWCVAYQKRYVFLSTDYVFDGNDGPYAESASCNPLNVYGKHKLLVEEAIQKTLGNLGLIIRTTTVYGWEVAGKNFVQKFIQALSEGKEFVVPNDQFATPTYGEDLSSTIVALVEAHKQGIYHAAGPEFLSRVAFAEFVADIFSLPRSLIKGVSTQELQQPACRPLRGGLQTIKLYKEPGIRFRSPREALSLMKNSRPSNGDHL